MCLLTGMGGRSGASETCKPQVELQGERGRRSGGVVRDWAKGFPDFRKYYFGRLWLAITSRQGIPSQSRIQRRQSSYITDDDTIIFLSCQINLNTSLTPMPWWKLSKRPLCLLVTFKRLTVWCGNCMDWDFTIYSIKHTMTYLSRGPIVYFGRCCLLYFSRAVFYLSYVFVFAYLRWLQRWFWEWKGGKRESMWDGYQ